MQAKVLFARFPFGNSECPDSTDWLVKTVLEAKSDPRISAVLHTRVDDTPITMSRNRVLKQALDLGADYVLMLDSDMKPDMCISPQAGAPPGPGARPFWRTAFDFALTHRGPCVIGAPYCGPPPHENVYVFEWKNFQSDHRDVDMRLEAFTREQAACRAGFEEVAALPTGLILIAMAGVKKLTPPWFDYEWADPPFNTEKASTEDVYFTRNLSLAGVPCYVLWDAWAGHWKRKCVGKPSVLTCDMVRDQFHEAVLSGRRSNEKLIHVNGISDQESGIRAPIPCRDKSPNPETILEEIWD